MERELILAVKKHRYNKKNIEEEIENIKKTFSYTESFEAFKTCNQVFDFVSHSEVTTKPRLKTIFHEGSATSEHCYIFCLN